MFILLASTGGMSNVWWPISATRCGTSFTTAALVPLPLQQHPHHCSSTRTAAAAHPHNCGTIPGLMQQHSHHCGTTHTTAALGLAMFKYHPVTRITVATPATAFLNCAALYNYSIIYTGSPSQCCTPLVALAYGVCAIAKSVKGIVVSYESVNQNRIAVLQLCSRYIGLWHINSP